MVPAALVAWVAAAWALAARDVATGVAVGIVGVVAAALMLRAGWPQIAMPALAGAVVTLAATVRIAAADRHPLAARTGAADTVTLRLTEAPSDTEHGAIATAAVEGLPGRVTVFGGESLLDHDTGTRLRAVAGVDDADRPSLSGLTLSLRGDPIAAAPPDGHVARVRGGLADAAAGLPPGPDRLVPAMALGDERGFSPEYRDMMTDAGLAHLSAVSGANVALVVGAAMAALAWAPPRIRTAAGAVALAGFVAVVGTEPSVLRAMLTGAVGLIAVVTGRAHQALPALAGGCVILLVAHPDLAVSAGFMLSVAATAGLVLATVPATRRLLLVPGLRSAPAPVVRAVAVALVAHVATVPVLALTVGEVSHVSVAANVVAAPAVAPVTVAGTLAAVAVLLHLDPVAVVLVHVAAPFAWWVHQVGVLAAAVPGASSPMGSAGAAAVIAVAVVAWRLPAAAAAVAALLCLSTGTALAAGAHQPAAPPGWIALACAVDGRIAVVAPGQPPPGGGDGARACRRAAAGGGDAATAPPGTVVTRDLGELEEMSAFAASGERAEAGWAAVADCGDRARRRVQMPDGTPVVCPARDGPAALYPGGAVWTQGMARWDA
ncbi:ComEC/Rec2 family competence protein [Corynebacterium sp. 335C]